MKGQTIPIGAECEPILLTLSYDNPGPLATQGFPSNMLLEELVVLASDLTGVPLQHVVLKRVVTKGINNCIHTRRWVEF